MDKDHKFSFSRSKEMDKRQEKAEEFFRIVLDPEEQPYFVSDEATLYDIFVGEESQLINRCKAHYGVKLMLTDFKRPLWRLLDDLEVRRQQ